MKTELHPAQIAGLRRWSLSERFGRGLRFLRSARLILAAGIRARHPEWSDRQVSRETERLVHHGGD